MSERTDITPETKIAALLEAWPELEDVLIGQAPIFKNLKNPVLRKTVAKVATIEKAARMAGLSPRDLVRTLREAAGLPEDAASRGESVKAGETEAPGATDPEPPWVGTCTLRETVDADAILNAGETPLPGVLRHAAALEPGAMFRIVSAFRPIPLIDTLNKKGFRTFTREIAKGRFETLVAR